jgi:hypothetical protein
MRRYHKPYGTAYGLLTLAESLKDVPATTPQSTLSP